MPEVADPQQLGYALIAFGGCLVVIALTIAHDTRRPRGKHRPPATTVPEHAGATPGWSPVEEVTAVIPALTPTAAQHYAAGLTMLLGDAQYAARTQQWTAELAAARTAEQQRIDATFDRLTTRANRLGHLEVDTREITFDRLRELIGGGR